MCCMSRIICIAASSKTVSRGGWIERCVLLVLLLSTGNTVFPLPFKCVASDMVQVGGDVLETLQTGALTLLAWTAGARSTLRPLALLLPEGPREGWEEGHRPSALPR